MANKKKPAQSRSFSMPKAGTQPVALGQLSSKELEDQVKNLQPKISSNSSVSAETTAEPGTSKDSAREAKAAGSRRATKSSESVTSAPTDQFQTAQVEIANHRVEINEQLQKHTGLVVQIIKEKCDDLTKDIEKKNEDHKSKIGSHVTAVWTVTGISLTIFFAFVVLLFAQINTISTTIGVIQSKVENLSQTTSELGILPNRSENKGRDDSKDTVPAQTPKGSINTIKPSSVNASTQPLPTTSPASSPSN